MRIRVHQETRPGEHRVALVPREVSSLVAAEHDLVVPAGAGTGAGFSDESYRQAGATISAEGNADLLVGVGPLTASDAAGAPIIIGFLDPLGSPHSVRELAAAGVTAYAMEMVPRTTQAQVMDALSSQATVAGYEAVLVGAAASPRFFPMLMTAAGTIRPSRVLVLGAGVAGLQAIATARRLGAIVAGYDIRPAAREQVESLGASFVGGPVTAAAETEGGYAGEVDEETRAAQQEALAKAVAEADVIITTAQVPGRKAPILVTAAMVETMKLGAVIVDLAASTGGNCELTRPDDTVAHGGVQILGPTNLSARTATHASEMYSRNVASLITHLFGPEGAAGDPEDEIATATLITKNGEIANERVRQAVEGGS